MALAPLCWFSATSSTTHNQIGSFWCCFLSGWICIHSRTLWVSPMNFPVRLGVSPAAASTSKVFSIRGLRLYFPVLEPWVAVCVTTQLFLPASLHENVGLPCPPATTLPGPPATNLLGVLSAGYPSPPLLPVWMNVSSLTPWLSDFHTV